MPLELEIIRASEFIRLGAQGTRDLAASRAALMSLAKACRKRGIDRALLDVRGIQSSLSPTDLATLVDSFRELGFTPQQRLAVLHSGDPQFRARTFALIGTLRGWKVKAFGAFEEAVVWLSSGKEIETSSGAYEVPVKKGSHAGKANATRFNVRCFDW